VAASEAERLALEHQLARLATEVAWHEQVLDRLPNIAAEQHARHDAHPGPLTRAPTSTTRSAVPSSEGT